MADREKVIDILGACGTDDCDNCPLNGDERCSGFVALPLEVLNDAIALLKEQEPKMVVQTTSTIRCPGCGKQITNKGAIHKEIKYCWKCGQAVKWDD